MKKTLIIAEAGVNHNGNLELAKKLVDAAKEAGADIVKFQTAQLDSLVSKFAPMAEYQKKNIGEESSQREMLKKLLLPFEDFIELRNYCIMQDIEFLSTPFDIASIKFLEKMVNVWKIPSGEITNLPYLIEIAKTKKPIIMSTGMCDLYEVEEAIEILKKYESGEVTLLHCNTQYPTPFEDVNLASMNTLRKKFGVEVGYSDHTLGIEVPIAAVALGATVIEKHFTLDKKMSGPDHKASLEPQEFAEMVNAIRHIENSIGDGQKRPSVSEEPNKAVVRKSIVAARRIKKGEIFTEDNLTTKRPGNGISPMNWFEVLGKEAIRDFEEDELIKID